MKSQATIKLFLIVLIALFLNQKLFSQAPVISSFAPLSGNVGSSVTINGTGFNANEAQNIVFFGATQATVTSASTTSLTVTVPVSATYYILSVTNLATN